MKTDSDSPMVYGKVPPNAQEAEKAILGAILLEKDAIYKATEFIPDPEYFYNDNHKLLFKVLLEMFSKRKQIDLITAVEYAKSKGVLEEIGGPYELTILTRNVSNSSNMETHCQIVKEKFLMREQINMASSILTLAYDPSTDVYDLMDSTESILSQLSLNGTTRSYKKASELYNETVNDIERNKVERKKALDEGREYVAGLDTGFPSINALTEGWHPTDLIILAARPAVGKTALALNFALKACEKGTRIGFFSLEMGNKQLMQRLISNKTEIYLKNLKKGKINDDESYKLTFSAEEFENINLFIDDTSSMTILDFRSKARHLVYKEGVEMIIVDYLQLMNGVGKTGNREQEVSYISRQLKILAKDLNIPIIALSQLSRGVENRKDGLGPQLSDLRESGAIEQDADVVIFASRPDTGLTPDEITAEEARLGEPIKGLVKLKWAKHRNGELDTISLKANLGIQKFYDPTTLTQSEISDQFGQGNWKPIQQFQEPQQNDLPF